MCSGGGMWERFYPRGDLRSRVLVDLVRRQWLIHWRWIFVAATLVLLVIDRQLLPHAERPNAVLVCALLLGAVNAFWLALQSRLSLPGRPVSLDPGLLRKVVLLTNAQMLVDLVLLSVLLRYTGGVENPLVVFYLFHVVLAAHLLRPANALLQGLAAWALYSFVVVGEWAGWLMPHYAFLPALSESGMHQDGACVVAAVGALGVAVSGCLLSMTRVSLQVDAHEQALETAHRDLQASYRAIEKLQEQRARFTRTAAHQLKSPVAAVQTLAGLIRDGIADGTSARDVAERIIRRCRAATQQVEELLTLARVEQSSPQRHRAARADASRVLASVLERFSEAANLKGIRLSADDRAFSRRRIAVDERDLEDCAGNLLDNAIKYTPGGGAVSIATRELAEGLEIRVADTGIGIAEESHEELFEPFRRGHTALQSGAPGSGLGLAIVREVLEQSGGHWTVTSRVGEGTTVALVFPWARNEGERS